MLIAALATLVLSQASPRQEPSLPLPSTQFELGGGLGVGYAGAGLQLALRMGHFELDAGVGPMMLFGDFMGGLRYVAQLRTGRSFTFSLLGGSFWLHPGRANEFGPSESLFMIGSIFGGRHVYPSGWFTQAGIGPALLIEVCHSAPGCDPGTHYLPGLSFELGFGYGF